MVAKALLTNSQMSFVENQAIKSGKKSTELMENAGTAVVKLILKRYKNRNISVLCGPGKNGGDGFVVARLLKEQGWNVRLGLTSSQKDKDSIEKAELWKGNIEPLNESLLYGNPIIIDAMFGAGLKRKLTGIPLALVTKINNKKLDCIAIDIPSGIDGDSGKILGDAPKCKLTITFFCAKPGHFLMPSKSKVGEVIIEDIGISNSFLKQINVKTFLNTPELWKKKFPIPTYDTHKYKRGHLLIAGAANMTGATHLASSSARRIGAGVVTIGAPSSSCDIYKLGAFGHIVLPINNPGDWNNLLKNYKNTATLIGPGLGKIAFLKDVVIAALNSKKPVILDADGLNIFKNNPLQLFHSTNRKHILTPHEGEFKKLFNFKGNPISRVSRAAKKSGAIVLLKGSSTIIAHPNGKIIINDTGKPYLATAGSGDVLAGIIAGLITQGMNVFEAGCGGTWIHGRAAELFGPGLIAEDIPKLIPTILNEII